MYEKSGHASHSVNHTKKSLGIWGVYKFLTKYFLKSGVGPFIAFFLPLILHVILGFLIKSGNTFSGIATNVGLLVGLLLMPNAVMQFKTTSVIKMLGASPVRPKVFFFAIVSYFTCLLIVAVAWLCLWSLVIFQGTSKMVGLGTASGFFSFLVGTFVNGILCMGIGCLILNFSKSTLSAQVYGLILYFPVSFLTGQFIPPAVYLSSDVIFWIGRMTPWHYITLWNIQAINGDTYIPLFNFSTHLFELAADGSLQMKLIANTDSFAYADYRIPNDLLAGISARYAQGYNATYNAVLSTSGQADALVFYRNAFEGAPYESRIFFSKQEHAVAYVYPLVLSALTVPAVLRTFRWG